MKLPLLNFKKINQKNSNRKTLINLDKKRFFLNNFVHHDSNTSSSSTIKKKTFDISIKDGYQTQRIFKVNNSNKDKLFNLTKIKDEIVNNQNRYNILNSYSKLSNKATLNHLDSNENETSKSNNYEKYIKKAFGNLKIKKEISSFLYSSPEKQKRLINYLSLKYNNNSDDNNTYFYESINCCTNTKNSNMKKLQKKFINIIIKDDRKNEKDEDKTNLKEISLFSLFMRKKNYKIQSKKKYKRNEKNKFIEGWDNNVLKNILPQNIKNQSHINIRTKENCKNEEKASENNGNLTCRICGLKSLNINSLKSNFQKKVNYKYNFENDELNKIFSNSNKKQKLARAFSNL